ncbi:uncharacterized protein LOC119184072 [Rhipicephalus microplus]|uniref:uncharacterized protein LOC119184072 n=1 Tax=Rhipicephalus microplus TaxID=6941 RepID=UPI003F6B1B92
MREKLPLTTFEQDKEIIYYMNGSVVEQDIYCDPQALTSVSLTRYKGLRLVGILSPTEQIEPSAFEQDKTTGLVKHYIIPIMLQSSDNDKNMDSNSQGTDDGSNSTLSASRTKTGRADLTERSGESIYPVNGTCETRLVVDTAYFNAFHRNKERLVNYLAVLVAFVG